MGSVPGGKEKKTLNMRFSLCRMAPVLKRGPGRFSYIHLSGTGVPMDKSQADMAGISAVFIECIPGGTVTAVKEDNG
jgi:hypothetical protein